MNPPSHPSPAEAAARAVQRGGWISGGVNAGLVLLQLTAGALLKSPALVADGLHTLSDLLGDAVVLASSRRSRRAADARYPYGHARFETLGVLALAGLLAVVGVGLLLSGVQKLQQPALLAPASPVAVGVALFTLVAKEALFRHLRREGSRWRSSLLLANAQHARADAASSLVVGAALLGSAAGWPLLDPLAAAVVGGLILVSAWRTGQPALHALLDGAADAAAVAALQQTLEQTPGVRGVHDLRTRRAGDLIAADVHLEVDGQLSVAEGHAIALAALRRAQAAHPLLTLTTHLDPWPRLAGEEAGEGQSAHALH